MKTTGIVVGVIAILAVGTLVLMSNDNAPNIPNNDITGATGNSNNQNNATSTATSTSQKSYTAVEVATHNSQASCWSIIDNNVYDLTSWIAKHPGGAANILRLCGKDGSALFHGQHADAQKQKDIIATMKIGALAK
jgi:cytochrome b involved in lipid metabolism